MIYLHTHTHVTSLLGLRFRQFGWNLLTWRTWMAHLMLRWCSWLLTLRYSRSFCGRNEADEKRHGGRTRRRRRRRVQSLLTHAVALFRTCGRNF